MAMPYEITGFVGHGGNGSVFLARYDNRDAAIKFVLGRKNQKDLLSRLGKKEYNYLEKLSGIDGIPEFIHSDESIFGTYEQLGLERSGKRVDEVVPTWRFPPGEAEPYFGGAFIEDYIENAEKLSRSLIQYPKSYFDKLDKIVKQVHERNIGLPGDVEVLVSYEKPYLVDWTTACDFTKVFGKDWRGINNKIKSDIDKLNDLRKCYQIQRGKIIFRWAMQSMENLLRRNKH